jgi:hypothetical protein
LAGIFCQFAGQIIKSENTKSSTLRMTNHQLNTDTMHRSKRRKAMTSRQVYESPSFYQIEVKGTLDESWSDWFDGFTLTQQDGKTLLAGQVIDQAALLGILAKINDLGLVILSVMERNPAMLLDQQGV